MWSNQRSDPPRPDRDTSKLPSGELLTLSNLLNRFHFHLSHILHLLSHIKLISYLHIPDSLPDVTILCIYIHNPTGRQHMKEKGRNKAEKKSWGWKESWKYWQKELGQGSGVNDSLCRRWGMLARGAAWYWHCQGERRGVGTACNTHRKTVTHTRHPHSCG